MCSKPSRQQSTEAPSGFTWRHKVVLALMLLATLLAWAGKDPLRTWRWSRRLERAESEVERRLCALHLAALGPTALPSLESFLDQGSDPVRTEVVAALGKIADPRATEILLKTTTDADAELRERAVRALANQPAELSSEALTTVLERSDERLGMVAASALASLNTESAWRRLREALSAHALPGVRVQIIEEFAASRRAECVPQLVEALADAAVFDGRTLMEEHQAAIFPRLAPRIETELHGESGWSLDLPLRHVVGEDAAAALRAITGRDFEYRFDDAESVRTAIASWRLWLEDRDPP